MPELPEIETIKNSIQAVAGSRITDIDIRRDDIIKLKDYDLQYVKNRSIQNISRRGKFLVICLENERYIVVHLGMSGRFYMVDDDEPLMEPHMHALIYLDNGHKLIYQDARRFGGIWLVTDISHFFIHMGIEPLDNDFNASILKDLLHGRKIPIKSLLMNQHLIAGIGNIYADEALFEAGISPHRAAGSLQKQEIESLCQAIKKVLVKSIEQRGTTFRDYRDGLNRSGGYQDHLQVYGKNNQPCPHCGYQICRDVVGGRSSHYCSRCQK